MVKVTVGGQTFDLPREQTIEAFDLAQASLEKGGIGPTFFGRGAGVTALGEALVTRSRREQFIGQESALRFGRIRAIERSLAEQQAQQSLLPSAIPEISGLRDLSTSELGAIRTTADVPGAIRRQSLLPLPSALPSQLQGTLPQELAEQRREVVVPTDDFSPEQVSSVPSALGRAFGGGGIGTSPFLDIGQKKFIEASFSESRPLVQLRDVLRGGIPEDIKEKGTDILTFASGFAPFPTPREDIRRDIARASIDALSLEGQIVAEILPTTPIGVAAFIAPPLFFRKLPGVLRVPAIGGFTAFETKAFVEAETLPEKIAAGIGIGLGATGLAFEGAPFARGLFAKRAKVTPLGEEIFTGVKTPRKTPADFDIEGFRGSFKTSDFVRGKADIAIIPPGGQLNPFGEGFAPKFRGNIPEVIKLAEGKIPFRQEPIIPKLTKQQREILSSLESDEIVGGSLARNILLERQRGFKDIDILSRDPLLTAERILKRGRGRLELFEQPTATTIRDIRTQIELADIVPLSRGEGGFIRKFPVTEVGGLRVASPESILGGKLTFLRERGTAGRQARKTLLDVGEITGGRIDVNIPTVKGAFGFSFAEQLALAGKRANIGISALDFAKSLTGDVKLTKALFGTPSAVGKPFLIRESRLDLGSDFFKFPPPKARTRVQFGRGKSQALILRDVKIDTGGLISPKALRDLARRADLGNTKATSDLLQIIERFKKTGSESFVPSAQRRGELEVVKLGGALDILGQGRTIRVGGKGVRVFELVLPKKGKAPREDRFGFSKDLQNLLGESREKGFGRLPIAKQRDIFKQVRQESGFDIERALGNINIISPPAVVSPSVSLGRITQFPKRRGGISFDRRDFLSDFSRRGGLPKPDRRPPTDDPRRRPDILGDPFRGFPIPDTRRRFTFDFQRRDLVPPPRRTPLIITTTTPPPGKKGFIFDLPSIGFPEKPPKRVKGKRKLRRTVSLISLPSQLNIRLPKFTLAQERTGLVARSLIAPRQPRRRKRRK